MRRVDGLDDLRVCIAQRVGCPAVLKVNVASAIHVPDEITESAIYDDLIGTAKSAPAGFFQLLPVEDAAAALINLEDAPHLEGFSLCCNVGGLEGEALLGSTDLILDTLTMWDVTTSGPEPPLVATATTSAAGSPSCGISPSWPRRC